MKATLRLEGPGQRIPIFMANFLKATPFISKKQVDSLLAATNHAGHYGMPINATATIHWAVAGGPGGGTWRDRQKRLFVNVRHWLARRNTEWASCWAVEAGQLGKEVHTHIGFHHPPHISLADIEAYLRGQLGGVEDRVLVVKPVGPPHYFPGWRRYMLKGLNPELGNSYGIKVESQGLVTGKRCGVSRNIDAAARVKRMTASLEAEVAA